MLPFVVSVIIVAHGASSLEGGAGRSWAMSNTPNISIVKSRILYEEVAMK
jgi:hypothetical protein